MGVEFKQLAAGRREYGPESWTEWWLFELLGTEVQQQGVLDQLSIGEHYGGPGQYFCGRPAIRHGRTKTLITQRAGYDV